MIDREALQEVLDKPDQGRWMLFCKCGKWAGFDDDHDRLVAAHRDHRCLTEVET